MDVGAALDFVRANPRGVLATRRRSGDAQQSPVLAAVDDHGRVLISTRETAVKVGNLLRTPRASLCQLSEKFFGPWVQLTGTVEIISLPEAMDLLVDYYRRLSGEHEDWDEYCAAMERERRCVVVLTPEEAGPTVSG
ncbi:PPOX class F420-dependent oxidoreductase [Georgenia satyanarayanai]|uniref:PPOX class F420-dependent oxidoreductase n=1 Tax=Georgenia satyanarayanai TaxID=860221 RepID=UPI00203ADBFD|nr:PPOX class F420-dependent oxidoreductase [Georgenia satyanarayanai]MCM3661496.1 PPOX class F420-dependent oxidoreductase [Georgenia satyanarayanai]